MRPRLLVVDDERVIGVLYREEFEDEGYDVTVVSSGEEALATLHSFEPDVVTLELKLRGMDGIETLLALKAQQPGLPVILCTSHQDSTGLGSRACDAYILKSSDLTGLKAAVRRLLQLAVV